MTTHLRRSLATTILAGGAVVLPTGAFAAPSCVPGPAANCSGADMRGHALAGADMRGADMRGADMRGMNLSGVDLRRADLRGARMGKANLTGANLSGANMEGMALSGMTLRKVTMVRTRTRGMKLRNVNFVASSLVGVDLRGARIVGGGMPGSRIVNSRFGPRPTGGSRETGSVPTCSNRTVYIGASLGTAFQRLYNLNGAVITGSSFTCARFTGVSWKNATIVNSDFRGTIYSDAQNWSETILVGDTDYTGSDFSYRFWAPAQAYRVDLSYTTCARLDTDQSNAVWGRYSFQSGHLHKGGWDYGNVTSTAYNNYTYADNPKKVTLTQSQQDTRSSLSSGVRPYLTLTGSTCPGQTAPDWLGGGY